MADYYTVTTTNPDARPSSRFSIYLRDEPIIIASGELVDIPDGTLIYLDSSQTNTLLVIGA